jgi:hypothetical protein
MKKIDSWYWLYGDSFDVINRTERAYQLSFGSGRRVWIPKSQLRIMPDKTDWEVAAWWIDKNGLEDIVTDEEAHSDDAA